MIGQCSEARKARRRRSVMLVTVKPLEPELWPAFEDLFGKQGAYG